MAATIIDAGPCLNFLASHCERILFHVVDKGVSVPASVKAEALRKAMRDSRFKGVPVTWAKLEANSWLHVLSDEITLELQSAAMDVLTQPLVQRQRQARDLGEVMVITHAVSLAYAGHDVVIIMDDGAGRALASTQIARLDIMRTAGERVGEVALYGTVDILRGAAGSKHLVDMKSLREVYGRLRLLDDGLPNLADTGLLDQSLWS